MGQQSSAHSSATTPDLRLRLWGSKAKALSLESPEFGAKRVPERDFRGANVKSLQAPSKSQKSARENPNLTGKVNVGQIWFRLSLRLALEALRRQK